MTKNVYKLAPPALHATRVLRYDSPVWVLHKQANIQMTSGILTLRIMEYSDMVFTKYTWTPSR